MKKNFPTVPRKFLALLGLYLACSLLAYGLLHCKYRPEDPDDAWELSYYYNYTVHHITHDLSFGSETDSVEYFRKTRAWVMALPLNLLGWTKSNAHLIDTGFLFLALGLWTLILRRLQYGWPLALSFGITALLLDPFFTAANSSRPESFVFFLASLSFWLFLRKKTFFSILTASLALETHPMGLCAFVYMAAFSFERSGSVKKAFQNGIRSRQKLPALLGLVLGTLYYLALHYEALGNLGGMLSRTGLVSSTGSIPNYLAEYFFQTKYYRHIPELLLLALAGFYYWRKKFFKADPFIGWFLLILFLFTLVIPRPNFHYTLYVYPAILLFILRVAEMKKQLPTAVLLLLLLLVPQYLFVFKTNHFFDLDRYLVAVKTAVPKDSLPVMGGPNDWFAFQDRPFTYCGFGGDPGQLNLPVFYLVDGNYYRVFKGGLRDWVEKNYGGTDLVTLNVEGQPLVIRRMVRR